MSSSGQIEGDMQGKVFPSYGECIYCGSKSDLTDEHIIPYSLGANTVISDGSCKACAATTSYLDGYLARHTFFHMRVHAGVQTRGEHPGTLPLKFSLDNDNYETFLPVSDHPFFLTLPIWRPPTLLTGEPQSEEFSGVTASMWWYVPQNIRESLGLAEGQEATLFPVVDNINVRTFARAIAKIAYCHAVLAFGLNGFRPLALPQIILGRYPLISPYVGSRQPTEPPMPRGVMHQVWRIELHDKPFSVIGVRLFSHSGTATVGMPVYHVVVGIPGTPKSILRHAEPSRHRIIPL